MARLAAIRGGHVCSLEAPARRVSEVQYFSSCRSSHRRSSHWRPVCGCAYNTKLPRAVRVSESTRKMRLFVRQSLERLVGLKSDQLSKPLIHVIFTASRRWRSSRVLPQHPLVDDVGVRHSRLRAESLLTVGVVQRFALPRKSTTSWDCTLLGLVVACRRSVSRSCSRSVPSLLSRRLKKVEGGQVGEPSPLRHEGFHVAASSSLELELPNRGTAKSSLMLFRKALEAPWPRAPPSPVIRRERSLVLEVRVEQVEALGPHVLEFELLPEDEFAWRDRRNDDATPASGEYSVRLWHLTLTRRGGHRTTPSSP